LVRVVIIAFKMAFTLICKFFVSKHSFWIMLCHAYLWPNPS
jgi:hypothetical protein